MERLKEFEVECHGRKQPCGHKAVPGLVREDSV